MYYTQKQRNKLYKNAYNLIESLEELFVCSAIEEFTIFDISANKQEFPELFLFKDNDEYAFLTVEGVDEETGYYRSPKMRTRKLWVLAFCIAMTE